MLKNMKLSVKLISGFTIVAIISLVVGFVGWNGVTSVNKNLKNIANVELAGMRALEGINSANKQIMVGERGLLIEQMMDVQIRQAQYKYIEDALLFAKEQGDAYEKLPHTQEGMALWKKCTDDRAGFRQKNQEILDLSKQIDSLMASGISLKDPKVQTIYQKAYATSLKAREAYLTAEGLINELIDRRQGKIEEAKKKADKDALAAGTITIAGMIIGTSLSLGIGIFLSISITRPMLVAVETLSESANQVASASNQLSASSQQLAEGSAEQAASIEETSSTLEESSSMIQQNAENTKQASMLAAQAKTASDKGNGEMQEMMTSMSEIKKSSDQIAKIIKVIDEIAFQTNILALNAAVEAARAGDAGMGFAVVAEEVRNLAQRSAQAAKDTQVIIESNIELSEKGVEVAKKVGESLSEITVQSKKVNELMDEIAAASQEQTQGISQINKAVGQMDKVTQQIAANAEESASASEELTAQAENMKEVAQGLVKMVNGNTDINGFQRNFTNGVGKSVQSQRNIQVSMNSRTFGGDSFQRKAIGSGQSARRENRKTHIVNPEQIIPLEDDMQDF